MMLRLPNESLSAGQLHAYMFRIAIPYGPPPGVETAGAAGRMGGAGATRPAAPAQFHHPPEYPVSNSTGKAKLARICRMLPGPILPRRAPAIHSPMQDLGPTTPATSTLPINGLRGGPARSRIPRICPSCWRQIIHAAPEFPFVPCRAVQMRHHPAPPRTTAPRSRALTLALASQGDDKGETRLSRCWSGGPGVGRTPGFPSARKTHQAFVHGP